MSTRDSSLMGAMKDAAGDNPDNRFFAGAEQLDMLRDDRGKLPGDALRQIRVRRGPGRPPLSRNKRTEKVAKWFIEKYGDPLAALGEVINTPPDVIYEQMVLAQGGEFKGKRLTGRDAMEFWLRCVLDALPYIHGKQPLAIDITGKADAILFIPGLNAPSGFSAEQLHEAAEKLGAEAIERAGIRLADGRLLPDPDLAEDGEFEPVEDGEGEQ